MLFANGDILIVLDKEFQKYLPLEDYFMQGLYMFDTGQNDIDGAFYSKSEDQVIASFPTILSEFEAGIKVVILHSLCFFFQNSTWENSLVVALTFLFFNFWCSTETIYRRRSEFLGS
jgi:hypothetical protein